MDLREPLEECSWAFVQSLSDDKPSHLWHYTAADAACKILSSRTLWFTLASKAKTDDREILYGYGLVREALEGLRELHPAVRILLDDPNATLFAKEEDMLLACFTTSEDLWHLRYLDGVALKFDTAQLVKSIRLQLESSGLLRVRYDREELQAQVRDFAHRVVQTASRLEGVSDRLVAQYLMDTAVVAFSTKPDKEEYRAEIEWRMYKRFCFGRPPMHDTPVPHIDATLEAPTLRLVRFGPEATNETRQAVTEIVTEIWPGVALE
jgi:hypothetical protein